MTARKTRRSRTGAITEDAFGTPPAARGNMMNVAGASDDDMDPGEELLVDDGEGTGNVEEVPDTTMKGPVYPEGKLIRIKLGALRELVRSRLS